MRSVVTVAARIAARVIVLNCAVLAAGCGGPESGSQVNVSDEEVAKRSQGIKNAMKAGSYSTPPPPAAKTK